MKKIWSMKNQRQCKGLVWRTSQRRTADTYLKHELLRRFKHHTVSNFLMLLFLFDRVAHSARSKPSVARGPGSHI